MKIELLQTKQINGEHGIKGDEFTVSDKDGFYCINRGFAKEVKEVKPKAKAKK
jgi:hypothetical protein